MVWCCQLCEMAITDKKPAKFYIINKLKVEIHDDCIQELMIQIK